MGASAGVCEWLVGRTLGRAFIILGLLAGAWLGATGTAHAASSSGGLSYYGGPISHSVNVVLVEWGAAVRSSYTDANTGDPGFFGYLASQSGATTDIAGVLAQYMDTSGKNSQNSVSYGGMVQIAPSVGAIPPATVQDSDIQTELQNDINSNVLPAPPRDGLSTIYVVLFPPGDNVCDGGTCAYDPTGFCAYHGSFPLNGSTHVLYAAMLDNGPGSPDYGLCGPSSNDLANQTDVLSHEFAEAINDPLVAEDTGSAITYPIAWYDPVGNAGEIGDICVGSNEQAPNGPWTVQKIWSNLDKGCFAGEPSYAAPTSSFTGPSTGMLGTPVSFDGSGSTDPSIDTATATCAAKTPCAGHTYSIASGIAGYQWSWGDGSSSGPSSTAQATHTYATACHYQISLTVTDDLGFTSTVTQPLAVGGGGVPSFGTNPATSVNDQDATLNGTIDPQNDCLRYQFEYGESPTQLNQSTQLTSGPTGQASAPVTATVSGLTPSTTYYYALAVSVDGQPLTLGGVQSFTTAATPQPSSATAVAPAPPGPPGVSTGAASRISSTGATVAGTVNPNGAATTYHVEYGTSTAYGHSTVPASAGSRSSNVAVSVALSGLYPRTTYHYRLVATSAGGTAVGAGHTFTTAKPLAPAPKFSFTVIDRPSVADALAHGLKVRFRCSKACLARFTVLVVPRGGILQFTSSLVTVARGHRRTTSAGSSTATVTFIARVRGRLEGQRSLKLLVSGYAVSGGSVASSPKALRIKLTA